MGWQDLLRSAEYYSHNLTRKELSKVVSTLAAVANKRLKRLESKGIYFSTGNRAYNGPDSISGVRKFSVKGKNQGELVSEYKRVEGFLKSPISSLTGRENTYVDTVTSMNRKKYGTDYETDIRDARREYRDLVNAEKDPIDTLSKVFRAMREGSWLSKAPQFPQNFSSSQLKAYFEEWIAKSGDMDIEELINKIKEELEIDTEIKDNGQENDAGTGKYFSV